MKTKDSFLTISYKGEYIHTDSQETKWRGKLFPSIHAAKCAITRFINSARPASL